MTHLDDTTAEVDGDHLRHNNISSARLYPFNAFAFTHQANHETAIILEMFVHVTLRRRVLDDGRAVCEYVVSVRMVTVVARINQVADWLRCHLANETNELRCKVTVQHGLNYENRALADDKAGCCGNVIFVEHVIWQHRKHPGPRLF